MKARHEFESIEAWEEYLRYYYAGQAMHGLLAANQPFVEAGGDWNKNVGESSVEFADALIKALNQQPNPINS